MLGLALLRAIEGQAAKLGTAAAELLPKQQAAPELGIAQLRCGLPALLYSQLIVHATHRTCPTHCTSPQRTHQCHKEYPSQQSCGKPLAVDLAAMLSTRHNHHRQHNRAPARHTTPILPSFMMAGRHRHACMLFCVHWLCLHWPCVTCQHALAGCPPHTATPATRWCWWRGADMTT